MATEPNATTLQDDFLTAQRQGILKFTNGNMSQQALADVAPGNGLRRQRSVNHLTLTLLAGVLFANVNNGLYFGRDDIQLLASDRSYRH